MSRSPREVVEHHLAALNAGDLDEIVADYAENGVFMLPGTTMTGRNGLRETFAGVLWQLPGAVFTTTSVTEAGDVVLLEWGLEAASATATDGIDTFVISEGLIRLQTARFPPVPL